MFFCFVLFRFCLVLLVCVVFGMSGLDFSFVGKLGHSHSMANAQPSVAVMVRDMSFYRRIHSPH